MVAVMSPRPRVLHLFSGWNWVEPAPAIVDLCRQLGRQGHVVDLACARAPEGQPNLLEQNARERHVDPIMDFRLEKTFNPFINLPDIHRLTEFLEREEVQIVHVHTAYDHYIGSRAARRANSLPSVVRTNHLGAPLPPTWHNRRVIRGHTDAWVALAPSCRDEDVRTFKLDPARAIAVEAPVDLQRFNPAASRPDVRPALGLSAEHVVAGFVSGSESGQRFEWVMQSFAKAMQAEPLLRLLVIGRGMTARRAGTGHRRPRRLRGLSSRGLRRTSRGDGLRDFPRVRLGRILPGRARGDGDGQAGDRRPVGPSARTGRGRPMRAGGGRVGGETRRSDHAPGAEPAAPRETRPRRRR